MRKFVISMLPFLFPAIYFLIALFFDLPDEFETLGTLLIIMMFLGAAVYIFLEYQEIKAKKKYDGHLDVSATDTSQIHQLEITTTPEQLADQDSVRFKVRKIPPAGS